MIICFLIGFCLAISAATLLVGASEPCPRGYCSLAAPVWVIAAALWMIVYHTM